MDMDAVRIFRLREALGLGGPGGVKGFAGLIPVSRMTVFRWETGRSVPQGLHLVRLLELERQAKGGKG